MFWAAVTQSIYICISISVLSPNVSRIFYIVFYVPSSFFFLLSFRSIHIVLSMHLLVFQSFSSAFIYTSCRIHICLNKVKYSSAHILCLQSNNIVVNSEYGTVFQKIMAFPVKESHLKRACVSYIPINFSINDFFLTHMQYDICFLLHFLLITTEIVFLDKTLKPWTHQTTSYSHYCLD